MSAEERLALHGESTLVFEFDINVRARLKDRGVENGNRSHGVIHGIVHIFHEGSTSGGDGDATARHIHGAETYLAAIGAFVFTGKTEFVFLRHLLGYHESGVVEFGETVFAYQSRVIIQCFRQMRAKRLQYREDDFTGRGVHGESFEEVQSSIRAGIVFLVQSVQIHNAEQLLSIDRSFVQVLHVRTDGVVAVGDV